MAASAALGHNPLQCGYSPRQRIPFADAGPAASKSDSPRRSPAGRSLSPDTLIPTNDRIDLYHPATIESVAEGLRGISGGFV